MYNSNLSCCSSKTLVQDQVCIDWAATGAVTETVYTNNITQDLYASGYVKYDVGTAPITVNFSRSDSGEYNYCTTTKQWIIYSKILYYNSNCNNRNGSKPRTIMSDSTLSIS